MFGYLKLHEWMSGQDSIICSLVSISVSDDILPDTPEAMPGNSPNELDTYYNTSKNLKKVSAYKLGCLYIYFI